LLNWRSGAQPAAKPFALAGVYDVWKADGKSAVTSFAIVTTNAAPSTASYHDRMPLVLEESQFDDWMRGPTELAADPVGAAPFGFAIATRL
jgi:putative SOS response-associated peptidase YedK